MDGEDNLAVRDVLEQLLLGPIGPHQLALLVAARAQAPELAGEGDQELVAALRAAHPGDPQVEDAAVEIAVDRRLDAAAQVAVGGEKALLVATHEVLEVGDRVTGYLSLFMGVAPGPVAAFAVGAAGRSRAA